MHNKILKLQVHIEMRTFSMIFDQEKREKKKAIVFKTTKGRTFSSITEKNMSEKQIDKTTEVIHDTTKEEVKK